MREGKNLEQAHLVGNLMGKSGNSVNPFLTVMFYKMSFNSWVTLGRQDKKIKKEKEKVDNRIEKIKQGFPDATPDNNKHIANLLAGLAARSQEIRDENLEYIEVSSEEEVIVTDSEWDEQSEDMESSMPSAMHSNRSKSGKP
jgi:hypothetical protein